MNEKMSLASLVLGEFERIFLLGDGFLQGTRPCSVCGEGEPQLCKDKKDFACPCMVLGMDTLFVTLQVKQSWCFSGLNIASTV